MSNAPALGATARANLYGFFSRLFIRELDEAAVELLWGPLAQALLPRFVASDEISLLRDADRRVAVFDTDFVHITVVNVVPYASFYRREDARVQAGRDNPITDFLARYGFEIDLEAARALAQDHIGIVLEAMSVLCQHEAEATARPDLEYAAHIRGVQRTFLRTFVLPWAPVYLFAVERCAHTLLYREAADVLMATLGDDAEALSAESDPA